MLVELNVEVVIRKGLGPETIHKNFPVGIDDIDSDVTWDEIKEMAKTEVETYLRSTIDYPKYGKNWEIVDYVRS